MVGTGTKQVINCLAPGHNTVALFSLEIVTLRFQVYLSTTEPLREREREREREIERERERITHIDLGVSLNWNG